MGQITLRQLLFLSCLFLSRLTAAQSPYVVVLGTAQDGGHPQAGCEKTCCTENYENASGHRVTSLAVVDPATGERWLLDATPDFTQQFHFLKQQTQDFSGRLDGIFLTHAHIGHYTGLMQLGHEAMGAKGINVYTMPRMEGFLRENGPWSQLVNYRNIELQPLTDGQTVRLNDRLTITPFRVPHRDEFSETVGFRIASAEKTLVFIPDIDKWTKWSESLAAIVQAADYALIDGTFFQDGEIPRPMSEVPHPFVAETMQLLQPLPPDERLKVIFIHLNHTNPLLDSQSDEYRQVLQQGFRVAQTGEIMGL